MNNQLKVFEAQGKLLRRSLKQHTMYNLEMLREVGFCSGAWTRASRPRPPARRRGL